MDIETWRAMLERRGYKEVSIAIQGKQIVYSIGGIQGVRGAASFASMTYRKVRHEIENQLGRGMEYVYHRCGCPLLRARAGQTRVNRWYERKAPLFHSEYYAIPLRSNSRPISTCPQCGDKLKQGSIHKIVDPETVDAVPSI
jgi:hypothetical protein